ncbi:hypothetical protein [Pseudomonas sp. Pseu.R1]|uniref:hypothetical protein n=1 Tax=Pseudomonas sp. Pseu.R1 TaxID=3379818 RepID=UPI003B92B9EB
MLALASKSATGACRLKKRFVAVPVVGQTTGRKKPAGEDGLKEDQKEWVQIEPSDVKGL